MSVYVDGKPHTRTCHLVQQIGSGCSCKRKKMRKKMLKPSWSPKKIMKDIEKAIARQAEIIKLARVYEGDGDAGSIDFDDDEHIKISEGGDNGAYVSAWVWVPFDGSSLDKEA